MAIRDGLQQFWDQFYGRRTRELGQRFPGYYRAKVVETNDPLNMRRVRFKCPELHDNDLQPEECPWAVMSPNLGSKRCGQWTNPCIGDWVWITFEKGHPYGPICVGFATPTRRKFYPLASVYTESPIPVDERSDLADQPDDFDDDYLPKDRRPMSYGWQDRYGNLEISNNVGFFPKEHDVEPPNPDQDALSQSQFNQTKDKPLANNPDSKYMASISKYGHISVKSDIGYIWKKDGSNGEFLGDVDKDEEFEINRWKYLQRLIHEDSPADKDQRKMMELTRYGHMFEMRDVGWNKTRDGEYGKSTTISDGEDDQRWIKARTKGGMLIEACDIGFDPEKDEFVKRKLIDEIAADTPIDKEDKFGDDARFIRLATRAGRKIVIDDRESSKKEAQNPNLSNSDIGIGILIKGRASPASGDGYSSEGGNPIGYFWQFDERPDHNNSTWGSPGGRIVEISDDLETIVLCSRLPDLPKPCKFLEDNEFLDKSTSDFKPTTSSHHLVIDHFNETIRLKTRSGKGTAPLNSASVPPATGVHQGLEMRDAPEDNPWVELTDIDERGFFLSRKNNIGIWRAKAGKEIHILMNDDQDKIIIKNNEETGKIQIICNDAIDIIGGDIRLQADQSITIKANEDVTIQAGGASYKFSGAALDAVGDIKGRNVYGRFPQIADAWIDSIGGRVAITSRGPGAPSGTAVFVPTINEEPTPEVIKPTNRLEN